MGSIGHLLDSRLQDGVGHRHRRPQFFFVTATGWPSWKMWVKRSPVCSCWVVTCDGCAWIASTWEPSRLGFGREDGQRGDRCKKSSEKCSIVGKYCVYSSLQTLRGAGCDQLVSDLLDGVLIGVLDLYLGHRRMMSRDFIVIQLKHGLLKDDGLLDGP